jgi:signal transduction histidine kinase
MSPRWRPVLWLGIAAVVGASTVWALTPYRPSDLPSGTSPIANPVGLTVMTSGAVTGVLAAVVLAAVVGAALSMVVRWRKSAGVERQQLKWVLLGLAITLVLAGAAFLVPSAPAQVFAAAGIVPLPCAIGVAVLRFGLWDVDVVASRALTYTVAAVICGLTFAVLRWLTELVPGAGSGMTVVLCAVAAGLVTVASWTALQRSVNRLVHGVGIEPGQMLARLGARLSAASDGEDVADQVLPEVLADLIRALRARAAVLELADGSRVVAGDDSATPPNNVDAQRFCMPLQYGGEQVGTLLLTREGGFGSAEQPVLERLAGQAAVAVHSVLLARRLRRSRELIVLAREEERRRLRRDLHDGVGPSLAAVALNLETARDLAEHDPAAAVALLDRLTPRVNAVVADVRALVWELRPPTLDELGLTAAVRELADRLSTAETKVVAGQGDPGVLPAAVEVAAYRIAGEAAANAVRHAGASEVRIEMFRGTDTLRVTVADDGTWRAPSPATSGGLGLDSMRQRAEELGGVLTIAGGPAGTVVSATLPIASEPSDESVNGSGYRLNWDDRSVIPA